MKNINRWLSGLLTCFLLLFSCVLNTGCTSAEFQSALTQAESGAWTIANAYETVNTATGGTLTTSLLNSALVATHNTPDESLVDTAAKLADAAIAAKAAAANAGATPTAQQAAVTNVLSDPGVIESAAILAPAALQVPVGSPGSPAATASSP
jgi:hypothetical protein